jgi:putative DNA primase/helicase
MNFTEFAQAHGLIVEHIPADGRWHRFKTETHPGKRNGAAKLFDGGRLGYIQDHAAHPEPLKWTAAADAVLPQIDHAAIARRKADERAEATKALRAMARYWVECEPRSTGHKYLADHGLDMTGCKGLRIDGDGWLVVPALRDGAIVSVQRISPEGIKRFWPGCSMAGATYTIDRPGATITVFVEGLATGLAVYAACPMARVIVAFDAGNLSKLEIHARGLATVAADNDLATFDRLGRNPGVDAATALAERIGCGVAVPEGITGTDWCDWRQEKRAEKLARRARFTTEGQIFKAVDAELAGHISRSAKFVRPK